MDTLRLISAERLSSGRLTRLLNRVYADYYLPIWLDPVQFERMCADMDINLNRSVVALVDGAEVGLALLSRRGSEGWVSGVGVSPTWRRQGIARQMMVYLQHQAEAEGLQRVRLEVLEQNEGAIRLYKQLGFTWERDLLVMTFTGETSPPLCQRNHIAPERPTCLLKAHPCFHSCDPSWQRALPSLKKRAVHLQGLAFWQEQHLLGYALYHVGGNAVAILDLAVDPDDPHRVRTGRRLLQALHGSQFGMSGTISNIPAEDPMLPAFIEFGYRVAHRQYEMAWDVTSGRSPQPPPPTTVS
jgi:GNAT superfamily N-acetyltransferase